MSTCSLSNRRAELIFLCLVAVAGCGRRASAERTRPPPSSSPAPPPVAALALDGGSALDRQRTEAEILVMTTPEWRTRAAVVESGRDSFIEPLLGLSVDHDPPDGCRPGAPDCKFVFAATRVCGGCAGGRWGEFEVDPVRQTLFVETVHFDEKLPYGEWRNRERKRAATGHDPHERALADPRQAFPDYVPGRGALGYGEPKQVVAKSGVPGAIRDVFANDGYELLRVEHFGRNAFPVFVIGAPIGGGRPEWRDWGARLVRANGKRACEVSIEGGSQRYQFDAFILDAEGGGAYTFVDGAFHPLRAPVR